MLKSCGALCILPCMWVCLLLVKRSSIISYLPINEKKETLGMFDMEISQKT